MTKEGPPVLSTKDVGRILGEERQDGKAPEPLAPKSVSQYLVESREGGRFAGHPFPEPAGRIGNRPYWLREQEAAIREWARHRPGPGARTDLPAKPE